MAIRKTASLSDPSPYMEMEKRKRILGKWYNLYKYHYGNKQGANEAASELREKGYLVRRYKKGMFHFLYVRKT